MADQLSTIDEVAHPVEQVDGPATEVDATVEMEDEPEEDINSKKVTLADLCAKGAALYAHKNYEAAAEIYAKAAEQQAELNGEMNPENSEILFLYGRSLFKVGQSKSDVLGGKASGDKKKANGGSKLGKKAGVSSSAAPADRVTEEGVAIIAANKEGSKDTIELEANKPLFQFNGDENFDDSDEVSWSADPFWTSANSW
jgi:HAT1-interacting factor 1